MEKKTSVLLVEDDPETCDEFDKFLSETEDMELVGTTNNAYTALDLIKSHLPDVVLLDLELHHGGGNGLLFLQELNKAQPLIYPYIIVITNNMSQSTLEIARNLGADFTLAKYEADYSVEYVISFIRMIRETLLKRRTAKQPKPVLAPKDRNRILTQRIQRELNLVGISPKAIGFKYLTDAILLSMDHQESSISRILAEKYKKTDSSIDRAMQNAISRTWRTNDPDELLKYYGAHIHQDRGAPTLMEFISYYATKLNSEF